MYYSEPKVHPPYAATEGGWENYKSSRQKNKQERSSYVNDQWPLQLARKQEGNNGFHESTKKITRAQWNELKGKRLISSRAHRDRKGNAHQSHHETRVDPATGEEYTLAYTEKTTSSRGRRRTTSTPSQSSEVLTVKVKKVKTKPHSPRSNRK